MYVADRIKVDSESMRIDKERATVTQDNSKSRNKTESERSEKEWMTEMFRIGIEKMIAQDCTHCIGK